MIIIWADKFRIFARTCNIDDTFTAVHKDKIDAFHDTSGRTKRRHPLYQRNRRKWKSSFCRLFGMPRQQQTIPTTVYRKPTHTDRLLDESSYNPTSHKATTIKTLTRANSVWHTEQLMRWKQNKQILNVFFTRTTTTLTLTKQLPTYRSWCNWLACSAGVMSERKTER